MQTTRTFVIAANCTRRTAPTATVREWLFKTISQGTEGTRLINQSCAIKGLPITRCD